MSRSYASALPIGVIGPEMFAGPWPVLSPPCEAYTGGAVIGEITLRPGRFEAVYDSDLPFALPRGCGVLARIEGGSLVALSLDSAPWLVTGMYAVPVPRRSGGSVYVVAFDDPEPFSNAVYEDDGTLLVGGDTLVGEDFDGMVPPPEGGTLDIVVADLRAIASDAVYWGAWRGEGDPAVPPPAPPAVPDWVAPLVRSLETEGAAVENGELCYSCLADRNPAAGCDCPVCGAPPLKPRSFVLSSVRAGLRAGAISVASASGLMETPEFAYLGLAVDSRAEDRGLAARAGVPAPAENPAVAAGRAAIAALEANPSLLALAVACCSLAGVTL